MKHLCFPASFSLRLVSVLLSLAAALPAAGAVGQSAPPGGLLVSPTTLTFPSTPVGSTALPQTITLTNQGTGPVTFTSDSASGPNAGDFPLTTSCGAGLAPGQSCQGTVSFQPGAGSSSVSRSSTFQFTVDTAPSAFVLTFNGTASPSNGGPHPLVFSPSELDFAPMVQGQTSPAQTVTVTNPNSFAVSFLGYDFEGVNSGDFVLGASDCGAPLAPGGSCHADIGFAPAGPGRRSALIAVNSTAVSPKEYVTLVGTGVSGAAIPPPSLSPVGGSFSTRQTVTLSTTTPGAAIFYTTDGSAPNALSPLYTAPLLVASPETIRAIAVAGTQASTTVASATYNVQLGPGVVTSVAGNGIEGFKGDGGPATQAEFATLIAVSLDGSGNLFIPDEYNFRIRKVVPSGTISTIAGNGTPGHFGDGGPATASELYAPNAVVSDAAGNIFIADQYNSRIRKISAAGVITTYAGNGINGFFGDGGKATDAELGYVGGIALDRKGNLFIADQSNARVRKVDASGIITTVAGTGSTTASGDGSMAINAGLGAHDIAVDASGDLYILDAARLRKVNTAGVITTIAGNDTLGSNGDGGPAINAEFNEATRITLDGAGNLYIADGFNNRVRKIDTMGIISTVAGNGTSGYSGDGGSALAAMLNGPSGVAVDPQGNLYFADGFNYRLRKVTY